MKPELSQSANLGGAIIAAIAASACCVGPLIFALLGIGGAGALLALEPYRPLFTLVTLALLGRGWYSTYRVPVDDCGCERPKTFQAGKAMLWFATVLVGVALGFPFITPYLF